MRTRPNAELETKIIWNLTEGVEPFLLVLPPPA